MKRVIICIATVLSCIAATAQTANERVATMMNDRQWFDLREFYQTNTDSIDPSLDTFARAMIANFFNKPAEAVAFCSELLNNHQLDLGNTLSIGAMLCSNLGKIGENERAAQIFESIDSAIAPHYEHIDSTTISAIKTAIALYRAKAPYQLNVLKPFEGNASIPFRLTPIGSDKHKSVAMDVDGSINGNACTMVFDTGAGANVISDSLAQTMNLEILDLDLPISGIGTQSARFAIVKELSLGDVTICNVPFYVVTLRTGNDEADEHMSHYQIIVGRNIMETVKFITFDFIDNVIYVMHESDIPATAQTNLCIGLDEIYMLLCHTIDGQRLLLNTDTGDASFGKLFSNMLPMLKALTQLEPTSDLLRWGGAGGFYELPYFNIKNLPITIEGITTVIPTIPIISEEATDYLPGFDGAIGIETFRLMGRVSYDLDRMIMYPSK